MSAQLPVQIFLVFIRVSLYSFGGILGVLPQLERILVQEHHWITHDQFIQAFVIGQFVPGPNMAMCPMIGYQIAGWSGFLAGFVGIYTIPILMMAAAYSVYHRFRKIEIARKLELSLRPLVLGLLSASVAQLWWAQSGKLVASVAISRVLVSILTVAGFVVLSRRWVDPIWVIFAMGALYWMIPHLI